MFSGYMYSTKNKTSMSIAATENSRIPNWQESQNLKY